MQPIPPPTTGAGDPADPSLSLAATHRAMERGRITSAALVERALARAAAVEPWLRAFAWLDPARARRLAARADASAGEQGDAGGSGPPPGPPLGLLHGVPVAVKDIVDTAGVPTEHGSALFAGRVPGSSAVLFGNLEGAGAVLLGKTVTAELAYFHPGPTRNPWHRQRTPGGSSMGSAAAVGAGIVPAAVGTQTNGSVIRPAAFCGVVGFKPSAGRLSTTGVLRFSETLDQPGGFTRSVADGAWLAAAMAGEPLDRWWAGEDGAGTGGAGPRLALLPTAEWAHASPAQQESLRACAAALSAAGAVVETPDPPAGLEGSPAVHRTIMAFEGARSLGETVARSPELVSETLRRFLEDGAQVSPARYREALAERDALVQRFREWVAPYGAVLTPPAAGEAPDPQTTGDPRFCTRWTLVGAPALTIPAGTGPEGLPLGLQLVGAPGADRELLAVAAWVERALPPAGVPPL